MSESLNNHMNSLLTKAIKLLAEYEDEIVIEWNHVQEELTEVSTKYADTFKFLNERLVSYMRSSRYGVEVHSILNRMREDAKDYFPYQPAAEKIIYILNLMENATHKVLKEHDENNVPLSSAKFLFLLLLLPSSSQNAGEYNL